MSTDILLRKIRRAIVGLYLVLNAKLNETHEQNSDTNIVRHAASTRAS